MLDEDGYLSVVDRKKDMIKTGGENVASREVEEAIYQLDGVAEVAVFGDRHPHWIEAVVAVVVSKAGRLTDTARPSSPTPARLAGYKPPKYVVFADALPKNPSGKILKRELRERTPIWRTRRTGRREASRGTERLPRIGLKRPPVALPVALARGHERDAAEHANQGPPRYSASQRRCATMPGWLIPSSLSRFCMTASRGMSPSR